MKLHAVLQELNYKWTSCSWQQITLSHKKRLYQQYVLCVGNFSFHHLELSPLILTTLISKKNWDNLCKKFNTNCKNYQALHIVTELLLSKMAVVCCVLLRFVRSFLYEFLTNLPLSAPYTHHNLLRNIHNRIEAKDTF